MRRIILSLFFPAALLHASDLIVDWSLDLRDPSPVLRLFCIANDSTYSIQGNPEAAGLYRYKLPDEIVGRCILDIGGGFIYHLSYGIHEIDVLPGGTLHTKFPGTSAIFEVAVTPDSSPTIKKELRLFKLGENGLPLPGFVYFTDLRPAPDAKSCKRTFVIPYAGAGNYLAYVVEISSKDNCRYKYAKRVTLTPEQLLRHNLHTSLDDSAVDAPKVSVVFTSNDIFTGIVGLAIVCRNPARHVRVAADGSIANVITSGDQRNGDCSEK